MYMRSLIAFERDSSVIYLDTRGAGRSEAPPDEAGYAFKFFIDDLEALRVHLQLSNWRIFAHSDAGLQGRIADVFCSLPGRANGAAVFFRIELSCHDCEI
jgi:pimeloyl-ACP methyl ester carboxylesterase